MWRVRRAAACSSSIYKWCCLEKNVSRCSNGLEKVMDPRAVFAKRGFSRVLVPSEARGYAGGRRGVFNASCRGLATRHDDASDLSESDEFEEPETGGLKELDDESDEIKDENDDEVEEEDDEMEMAQEPSSRKSVNKARVEKRISLVQTDRLEQELIRKLFYLKKEDDVTLTLKRWKEEGKELTAGMIVTIMNRLKTANRITHALQMIEWVVEEPEYRDFKLGRALQIEIVSRAKGIAEAEKLFESLAEEEKTRPVYSALLTRYVFIENVKKAESLFEEMDKAGLLSDGPFAINLMMKLYKQKGDSGKFQEMLEKAKEMAVEPNIFTYNVMLDLKGKSGDIDGMEKIFGEMISNANTKPDSMTHSTMCRGYLNAGLNDKVEIHLLRMEIGAFRKTKATYEFMMLGYGQLGKPDEVERMWTKCKMIPGDGFNSFLVFQRAVALAGDIQRVESMFKHMEKWKRSKTVETRRQNNLLLVYYKKGMKAEIKEQEKKMTDMGLKITLSERDKEPIADRKTPAKTSKKDKEKDRNKERDQQLKKALETAVENADVKAAETAFENCKKANLGKVGVWNKLLTAYVKAEVPAYGFLQRMKADKVEPNEETHTLLKKLQVEA